MLRGGWNPRRCMIQDSEPNALQTELFHSPPPPQRNTPYHTICKATPCSLLRVIDMVTYRTLLLSTAYTTWSVVGRNRRLSAARRNAWAGGMLYRDSVSLTPLIQVFRGRPLGNIFKEDGRMNREIENRIQEANNVSYQLASLLKHPDIPMGTKSKIDMVTHNNNNNNNNSNNNNRIQRRNSRFFTLSSLRSEPSPTRTLKWSPGQHIERLSRATCRVTCHVVRKDSSAIKFDRAENHIYFSFILSTEPSTSEGGEETGVPGDNPWKIQDPKRDSNSHKQHRWRARKADVLTVTPRVDPNIPQTHPPD